MTIVLVRQEHEVNALSLTGIRFFVCESYRYSTNFIFACVISCSQCIYRINSKLATVQARLTTARNTKITSIQTLPAAQVKCGNSRDISQATKQLSFSCTCTIQSCTQDYFFYYYFFWIQRSCSISLFIHYKETCIQDVGERLHANVYICSNT